MARVTTSVRIHESYLDWWRQQAVHLEVSESTFLEMMIHRLALEQNDELPENDRPGVQKGRRKE